MAKLNKIFAVMAGLLVSMSAFAAGSGVALEPAGNDVGNIASLQRGARNVINYCSGCHSAQYVRFNTIARDLQLDKEQVVENLMFNAERTFETIRATMPAEDAARWFGQTPPDISLIARSRGTDYLFNFLKGFYLDPDSPTGVDNTVLAGTGMPHVLWELQGYQKAVFHENESREQVFDGFEQVTAGSMSADDFDAFVRDTVNFLEYISEPVRATRRVLGVWVLMYLTLFLIIASMLKKQIWKDVS
jgi:ubiquinol-cytochrome c reductase cytochrome c1 subunit